MEKKGETWYAGMFPEGDLDALEKKMVLWDLVMEQ
jgi:hypothetical protein